VITFVFLCGKKKSIHHKGSLRKTQRDTKEYFTGLYIEISGMMQKIRHLILIISLLIITRQADCQPIDSTTFSLETRNSFYTFEKDGEFLLHVPARFFYTRLNVTINSGSEKLAVWSGSAGKKIIRIPFSINSQTPAGIAIAEITVSGSGIKFYASTKLIILSYKSNEVKTDRLTGGLIVNKRQFFPFGFYCYSPVYPTLPEEEVIKGFNVISPYQKILPETLGERKAYMDRCAELGMKVHYNLLSVSGGGGVGSKIEGISGSEKRKRLINEVQTFRDHPALLAWYISDEPNGYKIPPDTLEQIYKVVKENDPWHPVSMVFMAPFLSSKKYMNALDIVMADPYPIPVYPVTMAGDVAGQLKTEFAGKRAVWIVPQAFGGGELWEREPTPQELRSMTWQSVINGATGIQYFVRQGLNYFPKSTAAWGECGRMAMEIAELTPWLLSDEDAPAAFSLSENIIVSSKLHDDQLVIMAVNKINKPVNATIRINVSGDKKARLIFENRSINLSGGIISDQLAPFGSQVYMIDMKPKESNTDNSENLLRDPGFEDNTTPGVPTACYARPGGDRGATYFTDTREHFDGSHSLRLVTPKENNSIGIRFFPVKIKAGSTYMISLWSKSDPEQRLTNAAYDKTGRLYEKKIMPQYAEVSFGEFGISRFIPDAEWRRFVTFVTIPSDTTATFKTNLILKMPGQGVGWFDQIKIVEEK